MPRTLLAVLAHPDDELLIAGSLLAQRARQDRVVILYLTRGEATGAFGSRRVIRSSPSRLSTAATVERGIDRRRAIWAAARH